jgi:UrcA family protein
MSNLVAKIANIATLGVAVLPWIALSTAHAQPATVRISDLNLNQPAQVQVFDRRVEHAAEQVCADYASPQNLTPTALCHQAVKAEAQQKLAAVETANRFAQTDTITLASR